MTGLSATSTSAALFAGRRNGLEDRRHPALPPALEVRTGEGEDVEFANCASGLAFPRPRWGRTPPLAPGTCGEAGVWGGRNRP